MSKKSKNKNTKPRCDTVLLKGLFSDHDLIRYYNKYSNNENGEDEENTYQDVSKIILEGLKGINSKYKYGIIPKSIKIYEIDHENSKLYLKKIKDSHRLTLFLCVMGSKPVDNIRYNKHVYDINNGDFLLTGNGRLSINQLTRDCIIITSELYIINLNDKYIPKKSNYGIGVNIYEYKKDRERINFSDKNCYINQAFMKSEYMKYDQYKNYRKEINRMKRIERELKKIRDARKKEENEMIEKVKEIIFENTNEDKIEKTSPIFETKKTIEEFNEKEDFMDIDVHNENTEDFVQKHPYLSHQEFEELFAPIHVTNIFNSW